MVNWLSELVFRIFCGLDRHIRYGHKKHYLPLLILSILDLVPVVLFGIYTFAKGNMYGLKLAILDIVVSIIVVSLFSVCFFIRKNQEQRKIAHEAVS